MGKKNNRDFMMGSLVGGLIGAATALFLAPKSGREIRDNLGQQANMVKDRTGKLTSQTIEKGSGLANVAKEKTASLSQVVNEQSSQIMNKVRDIRSTSKEDSDFLEKEVANAMAQISNDPSTSATDGQSEDPSISSSIAEAVETIEKGESNEQPKSDAQVSSEDRVKTNS